MEICAADSNVGWLNDDLSVAAFWDRDIVFDANVFFAVVTGCPHLVDIRV